MKDYIKNIRSKIGNEKIIHPGARIIIENDQEEFLIIKRVDTGLIGLPAGAFEEDENIEDCIKREVLEETGLVLEEMVVIGISSDPKLEYVLYPNGDKIQYFVIEFYAKRWSGRLHVNDTEEVAEAKFVQIDLKDQLQPSERSTFDSLAYYKKYGSIYLK